MSHSNYFKFLIYLLVQPVSELYHLLFFQVYERVKQLSQTECNANLIFRDQLRQTKDWNKVKSLNNQGEDSKFSDMKKYVDNRIKSITNVDMQKLLKHIFISYNSNHQDTPEFSTFLLKLFEFISLRVDNKIKSCDVSQVNSTPFFLQFLNQDVEACIYQTLIHFLPLNKMLEDAEKSRETSLSMSPYKAKLAEIHANPAQNNPVIKPEIYPQPRMNEFHIQPPNPMPDIPKDERQAFIDPALVPNYMFNQYQTAAKHMNTAPFQVPNPPYPIHGQGIVPPNNLESKMQGGMIPVENNLPTNNHYHQDFNNQVIDIAKKEMSESHIHLSQVKSETDKSKRIIESFGTLNMSNLDGTSTKSKTIRIGSVSKA